MGGGLQVETFPDKHDSMEDYLETLKYAFLYAKTVTLGKRARQSGAQADVTMREKYLGVRTQKGGI